MAATLAVSQLLGKLAEQHERFMAEVAEDSIRVLQIENRRLTEEVELLRKSKWPNLRAREPPPIPQFPDSMDVFRTGFEIKKMPFQEKAPGIPARPHTSDGKLEDYSRTLLRDGASCLDKDAAPPHPMTVNGSRVPGAVGDDFTDSAEYGSSVVATRSIPKNAITDPVVSKLQDKYRSQHRRRIRALMGIDVGTQYITPGLLFEFMAEKEPRTTFTCEEMIAIILELKSISKSGALGEVPSPDGGMPTEDQPDSMDFNDFVHVMLLTDLQELVKPELRGRVAVLSRAIFTITLNELIDNATRGARECNSLKEEIAGPSWETYLNIVVSCTVVASLVSMGTSIDFHPDAAVWLCLEILCASVFFVEMCIKLCKVGFHEYFMGGLRYWNILDFVVTWLSMFEITLTLMKKLAESTSEDGAKAVEAGRIALVMRALRMARVVRMVKLLRSPVMKELANMLVGFVIGMPALVWVMVLFLIVLYMMGLLFRIVLGPNEGQDMIALCGNPDDFVPDGNPDCKIHWMYGEEFFRSVKLSMFTTFRFMIGDYSTRGGKSLAVIFSQEYGDPFRLTFCGGMITVMFGLFNIITAIFVDTTVSGLKHNDTKRKFARQYERHFVQDKLKSLIIRIAWLLQRRNSALPDITPKHAKRMSTAWRSSMDDPLSLEEDSSIIEEMKLTEEEFVEVMEDGEVTDLLQDLDVEIFQPSAVFDTFDPDGDGNVTVPEMVQAIMKLRGDAQKNDIIASMLAVRRLSEKFDKFQMLFAETMTLQERSPLGSVSLPEYMKVSKGSDRLVKPKELLS